MPFSKRSINSSIARMLKLTGQKVACYKRNSITPPPKVPTDLFDNSSSPDTTNTTLYYIFANFQQIITEDPTNQAGLTGTIKGSLIIPYQYRDIVNATEYFDPYLNGSKFIKDGAAVDDQGITITQNIKALWLPERGYVQ